MTNKSLNDFAENSASPAPGPAHQKTPDLHGASLIDENGNEIPITEAMIAKALDDLDTAWYAEWARRQQMKATRSARSRSDRRALRLATSLA